LGKRIGKRGEGGLVNEKGRSSPVKQYRARGEKGKPDWFAREKKEVPETLGRSKKKKKGKGNSHPIIREKGETRPMALGAKARGLGFREKDCGQKGMMSKPKGNRPSIRWEGREGKQLFFAVEGVRSQRPSATTSADDDGRRGDLATTIPGTAADLVPKKKNARRGGGLAKRGN